MFGTRLKKMRQAQGYTLKAFGDRIGMAESTISLYESEKREPDLKTIQQIAAALNTSIDYLVGLTDDPIPQNKNTSTVEGTTEVLYQYLCSIYGRAPSDEEISKFAEFAETFLKGMDK